MFQSNMQKILLKMHVKNLKPYFFIIHIIKPMTFLDFSSDLVPISKLSCGASPLYFVVLFCADLKNLKTTFNIYSTIFKIIFLCYFKFFIVYFNCKNNENILIFLVK